MTPDIDGAKAALAHLELVENPKLIRTFSRDFFWYSPVLKARMDDLVADFVVCPNNEEEIIETLRVCYAHNVPVTTRGAGTGNYGQAIPMRGGCVLFLRNMNKVKSVAPGRVVVEPGCILKDLDAHCKAHSGQEIRMFSSTWATATIGGFIAGGSGGVGSVTWGSLRDLGNIIRLRVVTMEESPRILELSGESLARVSHAYGTNGIITEVEMPLAPAYDWVEMMLTSEDFVEATKFADDLANEDGVLIKLASVYEAPTAHAYFKKVQPHVLQVRYGYPDHIALIETMRKHFPGEVIQHLEAIRMEGKIAFAGLSLVKFTTEERLDEIVRVHEEEGALIFNPHRYTLEEGGRQHIDDTQLEFKREADPRGLLNPGKMITWHNPQWDYSRMYNYFEDAVPEPSAATEQ